MLLNGTSHALDHVYVEPSPTNLFDSPRNPAPIAPTASLYVSGLTPGDWDVFIVVHGAETNFMALNYLTVSVSAGETVPIPLVDADFSGKFRVTNAGTVDLTGFSAFGNMLDAPVATGATVIPPYNFPAGTYYVRCQFDGGAWSEPASFTIAPFTVTDVTCG